MGRGQSNIQANLLFGPRVPRNQNKLDRDAFEKAISDFNAKQAFDILALGCEEKERKAAILKISAIAKKKFSSWETQLSWNLAVDKEDFLAVLDQEVEGQTRNDPKYQRSFGHDDTAICEDLLKKATLITLAKSPEKVDAGFFDKVVEKSFDQSIFNFEPDPFWKEARDILAKEPCKAFVRSFADFYAQQQNHGKIPTSREMVKSYRVAFGGGHRYDRLTWGEVPRDGSSRKLVQHILNDLGNETLCKQNPARKPFTKQTHDLVCVNCQRALVNYQYKAGITGQEEAWLHSNFQEEIKKQLQNQTEEDFGLTKVARRKVAHELSQKADISDTTREKVWLGLLGFKDVNCIEDIENHDEADYKISLAPSFIQKLNEDNIPPLSLETIDKILKEYDMSGDDYLVQASKAYLVAADEYRILGGLTR